MELQADHPQTGKSDQDMNQTLTGADWVKDRVQAWNLTLKADLVSPSMRILSIGPDSDQQIQEKEGERKMKEMPPPKEGWTPGILGGVRCGPMGPRYGAKDDEMG